MIYCYYDKNGILREIINDSNNRQGTNNALIYAYFEEEDFNDVSAIFEIGGIKSSVERFSEYKTNQVLPYNKDINYKYFNIVFPKKTEKSLTESK